MLQSVAVFTALGVSAPVFLLVNNTFLIVSVLQVLAIALICLVSVNILRLEEF